MSELEAIIEQLQSEKHRDTTKRNYLAVWRIFNDFIVRLDRKPVNWADRITLFVGHLVNTNKKSSTIRSYISAIKGVLSYIGIEVNENKVLISSLTRACRLKNDKLNSKIPIRKNFLHVLISKTEEIFSSPQPYLVILYQAMLVSMYYGLFRIGELAYSEHAVKATDVRIGTNKKKMLFILRSSKTHDKSMKPQLIKIKSQSKPGNTKSKNKDSLDVCPFEILQRYRKIRKPLQSENEQFFVFRDRTPVHPMHFRAVLNKLIMKCGLDPTFYSTVGFRAGRATDLLDMGISVETIRKLGRWKSNAVYTYLRS